MPTVTGRSWGTEQQRFCDPAALEEHPGLSIVTLHRDGALTPGISTEVTWSTGLQVRVRVKNDSSALLVGRLAGNDDVRVQEIALASDTREWGAEQRLFVCPLCSKRRRHLYADRELQFICRKCGRWDYSSRHGLKDPLRKVTHLRRRLGSTGSLVDPIPGRPAEPEAARLYDMLLVELAAAEVMALKQMRQSLRGLARYAKLRRIGT